jgi:uncharacterized protein (UPF0548 family)
MRTTLFQPDETAIQAFLTSEKAAALTYEPEGASIMDTLVEGFDNDYQRVQVGAGAQQWERAKEAIRQWVHFPAAWTSVLPEQTPIEKGRVVAMFFRLFGAWWRNSCRIVYVIDEPNRYGFAYGTLPGHIESGEEVFLVELDTDGRIWYKLRAYSQPRHWMVRLGYPLARTLQEKFRQDSALAVQRYVQGTAATYLTPNWWFLHIFFCILFAIWLWPGSIMGHDYGKLPLLFAFFGMTPMVLAAANRRWPALQRVGNKLLPLLLPAAVLAALALGSTAGTWIATGLATPWLLVCIAIAWAGIQLLQQQFSSPGMAAVTTAFGCMYAAVGGAWFWADRAGISPMGFDEAIVRLTALHFHFAGFALPVLTAIAMRIHPGGLARLACTGIVAGVPLTAVGITATQYHFGPVPETIAAVVMSLSGLLTGVVLLRIAGQYRSLALGIAGILLFGIMALSLTYGLRVYLPESALSIDAMRAIHGSLNGLVALPLAFLGIWGSKVRAF